VPAVDGSEVGLIEQQRGSRANRGEGFGSGRDGEGGKGLAAVSGRQWQRWWSRVGYWPAAACWAEIETREGDAGYVCVWVLSRKGKESEK